MSSGSHSFSLEQWVERLQAGIWAGDVAGELSRALFLHLADLDLFEAAGDNAWRLNGFAGNEADADALHAFLQARTRELACTEAGFALIYFLKNPPQRPEPEFLKQGKQGPPPRSKDLFRSEKKALPKGSADPSNLQIVKKVGRQMESFMALEKQFIERVQGTHTTRRDARKIYNAALGKIRDRAAPQSWEQISRRRHK
ncbi:hypothetical protein [Nitrospina watsonii]|uniref:Uncharacterized protein n=1 Tax=Nitrospina watsonii TaxID=1323948 RepID=A0ABM9HDG0_9BACT|nr:hypothetical protein [Nitrospina watsonii]CAI2718230.1 conserved protein of unknown function [Nitrospina watsonii]